MCGTRRKRAGSRMLYRVQLGALATVVSAICMYAQTSAPMPRGGGLTSGSSSVLPKSCVNQEHESEKIAALIESIQDHPTAGAYNTLGVLYAQADRLNCAVPAFQAALKWEGQNCEVHYNLDLGLRDTGHRNG